MTEEIILTGEDLMLGPPSPLVPPELATYVLENLEQCGASLRKLFLCLHANDIEPFCQDELVLYRHCVERRVIMPSLLMVMLVFEDKELRRRIQESERKLGQTLPDEQVQERASSLQGQVSLLERKLILASGLEGIEGFRQRWSIHGQLQDTKRRLEAIEEGMSSRTKQAEAPTPKKGWFQR